MNQKVILFGYYLLMLGFLYLYYIRDEVMEAVNNLNEILEGVSMFPYGLEVSFLDFCGSLLCCLRYRNEVMTSKSWNEVLVAVTLMQFGGTAIGGLLLGQTPSWMISKSAFPALLLAWFLVFGLFGDISHRLLTTTTMGKYLTWIVGFFAAISGAHAIGSWGIDKAVFNAFHVNGSDFYQSYVLCIAVGTFSASGGGILADMLGFFHATRGKSFTMTKTCGLFAIGRYQVSTTINRAFWLSCAYYWFITYQCNGSVNCMQERKVEGHSLLSIVMVAVYLINTQLPQHDPFRTLTKYTVSLLGVPLVFGHHDEDDHHAHHHHAD